MGKKSTRVALGGMLSALCVTLMFLTGIVPFATYAFPMVAGVLLLSIVAELGAGAAVSVYISVSLLSVFVVVDKEAAMLFVCFFGYYPIAKMALDRIKAKAVLWIIKFAIFNGSVILAFWLVANLFGFVEVVEGLAEFRGYLLPVFLLANAFFVVYDLALVRYYDYYLYTFRPKFLRR
jgi:hypothetical protein